MAEEIFDIVNDDDMVIGQEKRSVVHRTGMLHRGVHVCLSTPDGRLLIQRRSENRRNSPGTLDLSVSEHVKAGEEYEAAAQRGLKEELGLEGLDLELIVTFRMNYGPNDNEISRLFRGHLADPSRVKFDQEEVASVGLASLEELHRWLDEGSHPFCKWFEQMLRWMARKPNELVVLRTHCELKSY